MPYKVKRKTKAMVAREAGLEPLADWMWRVAHEEGRDDTALLAKAAAFVAPDKKVETAEQAVDGARDIVVERLSEDAELREVVRRALFNEGFARTVKGEKAKPNSKFERYFAYHERVRDLMRPEASHRYLAMRRGFMEEELGFSLGGAPGDESFEAALLAAFERAAHPRPASPVLEVMKRAARLSLRGYVLPSLENEVNKALREAADGAAIKVFAENLRKLLLASPFGREGACWASIRASAPAASWPWSTTRASSWAATSSTWQHRARARGRAAGAPAIAWRARTSRAVAVGNGTGGPRDRGLRARGAEARPGTAVPVVTVSEAGASVYCASDVAREEFPELDVTVRGAISIARRLQDPLAELVKVDPKSIGVGQYQHDVAPGAAQRRAWTRW